MNYELCIEKKCMRGGCELSNAVCNVFLSSVMVGMVSHYYQPCGSIPSAPFCYSCRRATNFQSILLAECVILLAATFTVLSALSLATPEDGWQFRTYPLRSPFTVLSSLSPLQFPNYSSSPFTVLSRIRVSY